MKTASSFPIRKLMLATAFSAGIGFVPSVSAFDYSALDLGNLGSVSTGGFGFASGLNATGQITGYSFRFEDGMPVFTSFITGANGVGVTDLNALNGTIVLPSRINATGQVAGSFRPGNSSDDDPLHA